MLMKKEGWEEVSKIFNVSVGTILQTPEFAIGQ